MELLLPFPLAWVNRYFIMLEALSKQVNKNNDSQGACQCNLKIIITFLLNL